MAGTCGREKPTAHLMPAPPLRQAPASAGCLTSDRVVGLRTGSVNVRCDVVRSTGGLCLPGPDR